MTLVISTAKTSWKTPASAFPSVCRSPDSISTSSWSKTLGVDGLRRVAQPDQQARRLLDERRRPADEDLWVLVRRRADSRQHVLVDPSAEACPAGRRAACQGDVHGDPRVERVELVAVVHVLE